MSEVKCLHENTEYDGMGIWECTNCRECFDEEDHTEVLLARKDRRIAQLEALLAAVECTETDGISCNDVNSVNWFDARDTALRAAGYEE